MRFKTVDQLVTHIETELYQAAGPAVQLYSEGIIKQKIEDAYYMFAGDPDVRWKQYRLYNRYTLDGTTGRTTATISTDFENFGDIYNVFADGKSRPLSYMGTKDNPYLITGTYPVKYIKDTTDLIRIIPATAVGDIVVTGRRIPTFPSDATNTVYFDYLAISAYICMDMATDDGANPGTAEKFRVKFEARMAELIKQDQAEPVDVGEASYSIPDQWFERP